MKSISKILFPILITAGGLGVFKILQITAPAPDKKPPEKIIPIVEIQTARQKEISLHISTQGTVEPKTTSILTAEVSGVITEVSPNLKRGGYFEKDDLLLKIDPRDYEIAVVEAEAQVASAEASLVREQAEADQAKRDWSKLGRGEQPPLSARIPQLAEAKARVRSAKAALRKARIDLKRTSIPAPYAGRSSALHVNIGQFVSRGTPLADVYGIDYAEVRLPLSGEEIAQLNISAAFRGGDDWETLPKVTLSAKFGTKTATWEGRIVRVESEIDPKSRLTFFVARVKDPYGKSEQGNDIPLTSGMFVEAQIQGRHIHNAVRIPRAALHEGDTVRIINSSNRLEFRKVHVAGGGNETVIIDKGLQDGDSVCLTPLKAAIAGMSVQPKLATDSNGELKIVLED